MMIRDIDLHLQKSYFTRFERCEDEFGVAPNALEAKRFTTDEILQECALLEFRSNSITFMTREVLMSIIQTISVIEFSFSYVGPCMDFTYSFMVATVDYRGLQETCFLLWVCSLFDVPLQSTSSKNKSSCN